MTRKNRRLYTAFHLQIMLVLLAFCATSVYPQCNSFTARPSSTPWRNNSESQPFDQVYQYRICNLLSPWNFPQHQWAEDGIPDPVGHPNHVVPYPGWDAEFEVIKKTIDLYYYNYGFNTFRMLCQRPYYYYSNRHLDPDAQSYAPEIALSWQRIEQVVEYIAGLEHQKTGNPPAKVILGLEFGWWGDVNQSGSFFQFTHTYNVINAVPSSMMGGGALYDTILYYDLKNEIDGYLQQGYDYNDRKSQFGLDCSNFNDDIVDYVNILDKDGDTIPDGMPTGSARKYDLAVWFGHVQMSFTARSTPHNKFGVGCLTPAGAYLLQAPYPTGAGMNLAFVSFHANSHAYNTNASISWLWDKRHTTWNGASDPIIIDESAMDRKDWLRASRTTAGENQFELSADMHQMIDMVWMWDGPMFAKNWLSTLANKDGRNEIQGLGMWGAVDSFHFCDYSTNPNCYTQDWYGHAEFISQPLLVDRSVVTSSTPPEDFTNTDPSTCWKFALMPRESLVNYLLYHDYSLSTILDIGNQDRVFYGAYGPGCTFDSNGNPIDPALNNQPSLP